MVDYYEIFERECLGEEEETDSPNFSVWLKEKESYLASVDISIANVLPPGIYDVKYTQNGPLCSKTEIKSDEIYKFDTEIYKNLLNEIESFWTKKDLYIQHNLVHKRGILLSGYPGTGKTTLINIISQELINKGGIVFKIDNFREVSDYINFVRNEFRKIQPDTPLITIIEDIDKYENVEVELLDFFDGQTSINNHVIICTSNNTDEIPDTFLRPSRIDLKIEVEKPNSNIRREYFSRKGISEDKLNSFVKMSKDFSLADLKELFISTEILGYDLEDSVEKIKNPFTKKNYLTKSNQSKKMGL